LVLATIIGVLTCVACLSPALVVVLGAIGLGTLTGRLDLLLFPLLVGFAALAAYRYGRLWRRKP